MNSNPKCLVAVPTFGRQLFLPRVLACFKRLDYDNKRLVIINDDTTVKYFMDSDPEIDIVNMDLHLPIAVKRNMFASWEFDIMFPLDDDDLFLPNRLQNHVREYQEDPYLDLYRNRGMLFIGSNLLKHGWCSAFTNSSYTRNGFMKSGGYISFNRANHEDILLRESFSRYCKTKRVSDLETTDFIYQWQGVSNHNTFNEEPIMATDKINSIIGDRDKDNPTKHKLHIDYEVYDNFVELSREALSNLDGIKIKLNNDGTSIERI